MQTFHAGGFSLLELLVALGITAIVLGLGVPSFSNFLEKSRTSNEYRSLLGALALARSEAVNRSVNVYLSPLTGSQWEDGFHVWADLDGDTVYDDGERLRALDGFSSKASLSVSGSITSLAFSGEGYVRAKAGEEMLFAYRTNPSVCRYDRDIRVKHTGHVAVEERSCE